MIGLGCGVEAFTAATGVVVGVGDGGTAVGTGGCCEQDTDNIEGNSIEARSRRTDVARHCEVFGNFLYPPS